MEIPTKNTPVAKCLTLATFACQMMSKYVATQVELQELTNKLSTARDTLAFAENAYATADANLLPVRVSVRFANHESDEGIKQRKQVAQLADGETNGEYVLHLFPDGTTPIIRPVGAAQIKEMRDLEGRYDALISRWPDASAEKEKLIALRERYEAALTARSIAEQAAVDAKTARDLAKEDFLDCYAEVANRVRSLFPRNKKKQDLFFDAVMQRNPKPTEGEESTATG